MKSRLFIALMIFFSPLDAPAQTRELAALSVKELEDRITKGDSAAMLQLGQRYMDGPGVASDDKKSDELYVQAAAAGNEDALALTLLSGVGRKADPAAALAMLIKLNAKNPTDSTVLRLLARNFDRGIASPVDLVKARGYYKAGWEEKDPSCGISYALCLMDGKGGDKDMPTGFAIQKQLSELGCFRAMLGLGFNYHGGIVCEKNTGEAIRWLKKGAALNCAGAITLLGVASLEWWDVPRDLPLAAKYLQQATAMGETKAMARLGEMYRDGMVMPMDLAKANELFQRAADANDNEGLYNLGKSMAKGRGIPKDVPKALSLFLRSGELGFPSGYLEAGKLYYWNDGIPRDYEKMNGYYRKAVELGNIQAMVELGGSYAIGRGVTQDWKQAFYWMEKAASKLHPTGLYHLGRFYLDGTGVRPDRRKGVELLTQASYQDEKNATFLLAVCYEAGNGCSKDPAKARELFLKAASLGHKDGAARAEKLKKATEP